jgi:hypothetical protein
MRSKAVDMPTQSDLDQMHIQGLKDRVKLLEEIAHGWLIAYGSTDGLSVKTRAALAGVKVATPQSKGEPRGS